ncbi:hypothetical protein LOZ80_38025 [Paenibacillus sp. HWE-109]|uniref:hypothetical protein n=1 Tax=Paenibacillus sp. HWE-109 TaxID=1306526 RepID=UPI001EE07C48|nr:hypothetical protein [Paenibacillus sp. HWE-109]UKS27191.1 hypothetical protein LOZ80_38025 [Paenibacillus sp. HWE-109]
METIQQKFDRLTALLAELQSHPGNEAQINQVALELDVTKRELDRFKAQAVDMEEIVLPEDYNIIFGDPRANDEIKSIIRQVKEQLWNRHNDEMGELDAGYRSQIAELNQSVTLLQADKESLTSDNNALSQQADEAAATIHALTERAEDAESKRDAASREIISLKGQIDELERSITAQKKPASTSGFTFQLTSSIKAETPDEKAARLKSEEIERINNNLARFDVKPLAVPTDQEIKAQSQRVEEAAQEAAQFQTVVQSDSTRQDAQTGAGEVVADASIPSQADGQTVTTVPFTGDVALQMQIDALRSDVNEILVWKNKLAGGAA